MIQVFTTIILGAIALFIIFGIFTGIIFILWPFVLGLLVIYFMLAVCYLAGKTVREDLEKARQTKRLKIAQIKRLKEEKLLEKKKQKLRRKEERKEYVGRITQGLKRNAFAAKDRVKEVGGHVKKESIDITRRTKDFIEGKFKKQKNFK